jgi:ABC-2 type transport system ATP-binding protein
VVSVVEAAVPGHVVDEFEQRVLGRSHGRWVLDHGPTIGAPVAESGIVSEVAVRAEGLVKVFPGRKGVPDVHALDGVDLEVGRGQVLGLLGPNGAGKTTAVKVLTTLLAADSGRAEIVGFDVATQAEQVRRKIGVTGQYAAIDESLTGRENLVMFGRLYHLSAPHARTRAAELLADFSLADAADRQAKTYSGGMRRRLDLAAGLIVRPEVIFLDEPTTGLDPRSRLQMWGVIRRLVDAGTTLLLTTQYLEEADELADTIAVIDTGKIIARGTADELKATIGGERIEVVVRGDAAVDLACATLSRGATDLTVDRPTRRITLPAERGASQLVSVIRDLDEADVVIEDIALRRPTLDEVFLALTGHAAETLDDARDDDGGEAR